MYPQNSQNFLPVLYGFVLFHVIYSGRKNAAGPLLGVQGRHAMEHDHEYLHEHHIAHLHTPQDTHTAEQAHDHTHVHEHEHEHTHEPGAAHGHVHANTKAVLNRLARAIGHLESVKKMVEDGRDCSEVLIQIAAVRSAINNIGKVILQDHIQHCIVDAVEQDDEQALESLCQAIDKFIK